MKALSSAFGINVMFVQYVDDIMQIRPYQQEMRSSLDVME
jgi:hypothetical protein